MKAFAIDTSLVLVVAAALLAAVAFARLRTALDRLHCAAFVNVVGGVSLLTAAFLSDGFASRPLKLLLILVINLAAGSAMSHAIGRAAVRRGEKP
jgi:monovalent cation/proton antiporter MnhG/PhaG subunit